ncbi:Calcium/proton exchanger like protein, partial [Aduncisulcus paluster]
MGFSDIWPTSDSWIGSLFMMLVYGVILGKGSSMIADGSELLLEISNPSIVGGALLPVLGAVPDSAMIIASALGDPNEVVDQVRVGLGTLAGSTTMLLTIALSCGIFVGRCELSGQGVARDRRCNGFKPKEQGISVEDDVPINARLMLISSACFLIVQIPGFLYMGDSQCHGDEKIYCIVGAVVCFMFLIGYLLYCVFNTDTSERKKEELQKEERLKRSLNAFMAIMKEKNMAQQASETTGLLSNSDEEKEEEKPKPTISDDKVLALGRLWKKKSDASADAKLEAAAKKKKSDEEEEGSVDEATGEIKVTEPSKDSILGKSLFLMILGVAIVTLFSDPCCDVLSDFSTQIGMSNPFYISFIFTPMASNLSELIASIQFASKKTKKSASMTCSACYGAAIMNNTLCLGVFLCLVASYDQLCWTYAAETITIWVVVISVGCIGSLMKNIKVYWGFIILALYPVAIILVALLN